MLSKRSVLGVLACLLAVPAAAEATTTPKLKLSTVKHVARQVAVETGRSLDGTTFGDGTKMEVREWSVGPCSRKSRRRAVCRFDVYGSVAAPGSADELFDCRAYVSVKLAGTRSRALRVTVYGAQCAKDSGSSRTRRPLPAGR